MAFNTQFDQSNKADWIFDISATDGDPGNPTFGQAIDFTGAAVLFVVKDENNCQRLSASIGSGITLVSPTVLEVHFTPAQMETLCPGSYNVGCVYLLNGETNQLFVGQVSVYDGIAQL